MDNITARLEQFRQAINTQADAEAAELTRQYEEKRGVMEKERSERSSGEALAEIRSERARVAAYFRKELSRCEFDRKNAVLAHRSELLEQLFDEVSRRISEWTNTPGYTKYLRKALKKAEQQFGIDVVIYARAADIPALRGLTKLPVTEDNSIVLGGINAFSGNKFADFTLDSRLAEQKADFPRREELRL